MTPDTLLAQLLGSDELANQISLLQRYAPALPAQEQGTLANLLKDEADQLLRSDARHSQQIAHLLYHLATITHNQNHHILGLFAEANALSIGGLGDHAAPTPAV